MHRSPHFGKSIQVPGMLATITDISYPIVILFCTEPYRCEWVLEDEQVGPFGMLLCKRSDQLI